jgi:protein phosphatase
VLVLCSDGLSGQVKKDEIARIVTEETDLVAACKRLIDLANENGGPDNITVIAARFDGSRLEPPVTTDEVGHRVFPLPETGQTPAVADIPAPVAPRRTPRPAAAPTTPPEAVAPIPPTPPSLGTTPPEGTDFSTAPTPPSGSPTVSPKRRQAGTVIAVVLLIALVATAVWFVLRTAQKVAPLGDSTRAAPAQTGPAPAPRG